MADYDNLKNEIDRLTNELDRTSNEKEQAAQYGLALLEEQKSLSTRCQDLQAAYENTRIELRETQEV